MEIQMREWREEAEKRGGQSKRGVGRSDKDREKGIRGGKGEN
jgi:hypothetical protein